LGLLRLSDRKPIRCLDSRRELLGQQGPQERLALLEQRELQGQRLVRVQQLGQEPQQELEPRLVQEGHPSC
jgi:hypothetical protein